MKKILIGIERFPPDFTGAGTRIERTIRRLNKKYGHEFIVLSLKNSRDKDFYKLIPSDFEIIRLNIILPKIVFPLFIIELFLKVNYYLFKKRKKIKLIQVVSFFWLNRVIMFSNVLFYKKRTILEVTLDGNDDPISMINMNSLNKLLKKVTIYLFLKIDNIIVQTYESLNSCLKVGYPKKKIWLRPNPVEENLFAVLDFNKKEYYRRKLGISNKFTLLHIGKLEDRKNQLFLVHILSLLKDKEIQLICIGPKEDRDYYQKLKSSIKEYGLQGHIFLVGEKQNVNEYMIASDIFVFASKKEGFATVLGEAMMSGLPIITTPLPGISRYINKKNGFIISSKDNKKRIEQFAKVITLIYDGIIKYDKETIRKIALRHFSSSLIDKGYDKIYTNLLKPNNLK